MANVVGRIGWRITTIAVGIPVGIAAKKGVEKAWAAFRPANPPRAAKDPDVTWGDALGWAALSAVGVAVAQLVTTKGAASLWRRLVGAEPPVNKKEPEPQAETEPSAT
jgi:Protein of unknown function (DUF4235)